MTTSSSTHHTPRLLAVALLALSLMLAACGSTSSSDEPSASDEPTTAEQSEAVAESDSPIEKLLGVPVFDQVALDAWFNNLSREAEAKVALCMRAQGFEYTPNGGTVVTSADDAVATDSLEYAQTRGFGLVADFTESEYDPARDNNDANAEVLASLSESERDAYFIALQGAVETPPGEPQPSVDSGGGCVGEATDEVFSVLEVFDAIGPTFEGYYDLYISDSRIMETTTAWQRCMSEDGYAFEDEDELFEQFARELDMITSTEGAFNDFDPETVGVAPGPDGGFNFHPGLTPEAQSKVDELGQREIAAAVANWECTEPHREVQLEVQREYEEQFVAEVGPQVAAIRGES